MDKENQPELEMFCHQTEKQNINLSNECRQLSKQRYSLSSTHPQQPSKIFSHIESFLSDFWKIYSVCDSSEKLVMIFGVVIAIVSGVIIPLFMYYWGREIDNNIDQHLIGRNVRVTFSRYMPFMFLAFGSFLVCGIAFAIWKTLSERVAFKLRMKYMQKFIERTVEWIEQQNLYQTSVKFRNACLSIEKATGDKVALFFNLVGVVITGIVSSLCVRWTFALFLLALTPVSFTIIGHFIYVLIIRKIKSKEILEKTDTQAVEATSLIKTVKMLRAEKHQEDIYNARLDGYQKDIKESPLKMGRATALFYFIQYLNFGIGYLFGIQCIWGTSVCPVDVTGSRYTIGDMHIVFFQAYACTYYFLQLAGNFDAIKGAVDRSKEIFEFIRESEEESRAMNERKSKHFAETSIHDIQFKNVSFAYPTNPQKRILQNLTIKLVKNKFNALVGATGSGKSTITQLLLKFYQPNEGKVLLGEQDIAGIDTKWLRQRIGYVGQEPTLFTGTIRENITAGKPEATDAEVWEALKQVTMHDFVMRQPQRLNYDVGFGGQRLSGGQKQRIAIARALIKKPQVLILDEATSALDRKSEKLVQRTLEELFTNRDLNMTVLCIAHRVRTIVKADRIFYLEGGSVREEGTFKEISYFKDVLQLQEEQKDEQIKEEAEIAFGVEPLNSSEVKTGVEQIELYKGNIYWKILEYTEHKGWYALSILISILSGLCHPAAIFLVARMYSEEVNLVVYGFMSKWCALTYYKNCPETLAKFHDNSVHYLQGLIGFAVLSFVPYFIQFYLLTKIQDQITHKLRKDVFKKLMMMPVAWYDRPENEGGQIAAIAGTDVKDISHLVSTYIPILVNNFVIMGSAIALCFSYFWQIGLLSLFSISFIALGGYLSMIFISGYDDQIAPKYEKSDKIGTEIIVNIKTLLSINYQNKILQKYSSLMDNDSAASLKRGAKVGLFFGLSMFVIMLSIGLSMYFNVIIMFRFTPGNLLDVLVTSVVSIWCGWVSGNNFFFVSHAGVGKKSARRIFKLLEEKTELEVQSSLSKRIVDPSASAIKGRIEFKGVSFRYSPEAEYVLQDVSLVIEGGQKAAFVGESGCGKSTLMLLLQRFYPFEGEITLDGINIFDYDLETYRSYFGVLNQEPSLFTGTIRDNVLFGSVVSPKELVDACKMTFAYDVGLVRQGKSTIEESVEQFLRRDAGIKGSKVSGGEKQRIACARAVLKRPRIFLMDEGTSALDRETERRVQENIDYGIGGVTAVSVAHRLETIENSDVIFVIEDGRIAEKGKFVELMERRAYFYNFVQGEKFEIDNKSTDSDLSSG